MSTIKETREPLAGWESFAGLWERANLIRAYFWNQRFVDEKVLLTHFLARLRRFFAADFCYCALASLDQPFVEAGQPEAGLCQLPNNFSHHCMDLVANSTAPITWHSDVSAEFGYRSVVVAPLTPPAGRCFGFLMLGHGRRRGYSPQELFLLQSLAGEFCWTVRDLTARKQRQQELVTASHDVKNNLQVIIGHAALIHQKLSGSLQSECEKHVQSIETGVQQITDSMNALSGSPSVADDAGQLGDSLSEAVVDIDSAISQSVALCRNVARERGVNVEVVYAPDSPRNAMLVPATFKRVLRTVVDHAASATRNESVRLTVRREEDDLEVVVRGMESSRVADRLRSLFEPASRLEGARDKSVEGLTQVRKYLDNAGGDVYLNSRPGEAAEFIVCVPIESGVQSTRAKFRN